MTDEDALLAAIIADPDDDLPRLVFADWLDEHGQPERAEFIRVQIEKHRHSDAERCNYLLSRESQLLGSWRKKWLQPIRELLPSSRYTFRRGFVEEIDTDAGLYLRSVIDVHRVAPIRDVVIHRATELCTLNLHARHRNVRLRAVVHEGWGNFPPAELDLLGQCPSELEPHLRVGSWMILAWSVWSVPDRTTVARLGRVLSAYRWPLSVGIRPFDDYSEFATWCPNAPPFASPLWLGFRDGVMVSHHIGVTPPNEYRAFWNRL